MRLIDGDALKIALDTFATLVGFGGVYDRGQVMECINAAETADQWISVEDRLPEEETEYLCWFGDYPLGTFARVCRWNKIKGAFWCYSDNAKRAFVTHWMPMPESPKEVKQND